MTLEDLREHDVLLPEDEWGIHRLASTTRELPLLGLLLLAAAAVATAYLGDGGRWTWVGVGTFLACLGGITWICDRAILRQRRRSRRERREAGPDAPEVGAGSGGGPEDHRPPGSGPAREGRER